MSIDVSNDAYIVRMAMCEAAAAIQAPHCRMRPKIYPDGNMWCVLYGENLQEGICGFGETVELACIDFDKNWYHQRLHVRPTP
jgi:hypothetical protein